MMPNAELMALGWTDAELRGFGWSDEGRTLVLHVAFLEDEPTNTVNKTLLCSWAEGLVVQLSYSSNQGGYPLMWDAKFVENDDGLWSVLLDFAGDGVVSFRCNDILIRDP